MKGSREKKVRASSRADFPVHLEREKKKEYETDRRKGAAGGQGSPVEKKNVQRKKGSN